MECETNINEMATPLSTSSHTGNDNTPNNAIGTTETQTDKNEEAFHVLAPVIEDLKVQYVYAVMHTTIRGLTSIDREDEEPDEVLALYATLADANNRVRREWEEWREAGGFGDIEGEFDGVNNWWSSEDIGGEEKGIKIWVKIWNIWPAGSEPEREWKRTSPPGSDFGDGYVEVGGNDVDGVEVDGSGVEVNGVEVNGIQANGIEMNGIAEAEYDKTLE
jgi:hypothetical protein